MPKGQPRQFNSVHVWVYSAVSGKWEVVRSVDRRRGIYYYEQVRKYLAVGCVACLRESGWRPKEDIIAKRYVIHAHEKLNEARKAA